MVDSCFEPPRSHKMEVLQSRDEEIIVLLGESILQSGKGREDACVRTNDEAPEHVCYPQDRQVAPPHPPPYG